ncbi:hypothetical protein [uncultured Microbulbifer sp.]|uniref:hypothetical protein n=1 Tax=uncultured Microbulbifer sp. TaxID=348147 RepID=UPI0026325E7E|nr:hypothetical protein [uncultured Microbulbifer sp.]
MTGSDKPEKNRGGIDTNGNANPDEYRESPQPAADHRSRDSYSEKGYADDRSAGGGAESDAEPELKSEIDALMQRAEATMTLATAWSENFTRLVHLEFQRTLGAGKRIVVFALLLFFFAIALAISLCAGLGLLGYYFTQSVYIGFGIFLVSQFLIAAGLLLSINGLRKLLGFEESKKQAREALNDVTALFKQTD